MHEKDMNWDEMEWDEELGDFVSKKTEEEVVHEETKDANGTILQSGDTVFLTRDLDVKGVAISLKRGEKIKNVKVGDDPELLECKIGKKSIFIKSCFVKKV